MKKAIIIILFLISFTSCETVKDSQYYKDIIIEVDSARIISEADEYLTHEPVPVTASSCDRSLGTINDFYSEGDYWWPNPDDPDGPYIRRDGLSNPDYFKDHREAMRNMSIQVASLAAAYKITGDGKYADHAVKHLRIWFIDKTTKMNPNMNYAQAIKGICPGRGVGLIDAIHLVEPARAVSVLYDNNGMDEDDFRKIHSWFAEFLEWMTTHEYGIDERERKNNHGTCWVMQAAEYARLTDNDKIMEYCRNRYKTVLLPNQMSEDGSFHMELERTKPYGYSLFNIDMMSMVTHILSVPENYLWDFKLEDGRGMKKGMAFIYPYISDKSKWPYEPDVMYWDEWPVRHPALLFGGIQFENEDYITLWKSLKALPESQEGLRNFPIREPVLWVK